MYLNTYTEERLKLYRHQYIGSGYFWEDDSKATKKIMTFGMK